MANSWRTERWPSLRLLTPNWQTRLPGRHYDGDDPDGFMPAPDVATLIGKYAIDIDAPVQTHTTVGPSVRPATATTSSTDQGTWRARTVVLASGACNVASIPPHAAAVPPSVRTLTPMSYRGADELADGGVLVVGGCATGVQLADEIQRSGRPVTLATGEHVRLPRMYRGRDILWWMEAAGVLDERYDEVDDITRARHVPSPQLIGAGSHRTLDLNALTAGGVRVVGRLGGITNGRAQFAGSLANVCALADLKLNRLLNTLDEWARSSGTTMRSTPRSGTNRPDSTLNRHSVSTSQAARSARSSGRRATGPTTPGSTYRSSTATAASDTTVVSSPRRQACTPWASRSYGAADRPSSTARSPTPRNSQHICRPSSGSRSAEEAVLSHQP